MSESLQQIASLLQKQINEGDIDVPMLPEVANQALLLAQNPDSDASEMAKLIQSDQSLAAHVMRIANSAAYTPLSNLVSLQQAIARLGMRIISEIALTAAIGAKMFHTPGYEAYVSQLWQHALATSLWSKEIARICRSNVEVAFLAGLLHSIGRPAVLQMIMEQIKQHGIELDEQYVHELENKFWHPVSQAVVNKWNMPALVIEAIESYTDHNSSAAVENHAAQIIAGAQLAKYMLEPDSVTEEELLNLPAFGVLNVYQDEIEQLLEQKENIQAKLEGLSS